MTRTSSSIEAVVPKVYLHVSQQKVIREPWSAEALLNLARLWHRSSKHNTWTIFHGPSRLTVYIQCWSSSPFVSISTSNLKTFTFNCPMVFSCSFHVSKDHFASDPITASHWLCCFHIWPIYCVLAQSPLHW